MIYVVSEIDKVMPALQEHHEQEVARARYVWLFGSVCICLCVL